MNQSRLALIGILVISAGSPMLGQSSGADTYKQSAPCVMGGRFRKYTCRKIHEGAPFNSPDLVKLSDADLIAATKNGKGKMPAYAGKLSDRQIKDVVVYIRTLQK